MNAKNITIAAVGCALGLLLPELALAGSAQDGGPIGKVLCDVRNWFTGNVGAGIATLAVIIIGIGALLGKVSWGMAMIVGLGVAIVFGADAVIGALQVDGSAAC